MGATFGGAYMSITNMKADGLAEPAQKRRYTSVEEFPKGRSMNLNASDLISSYWDIPKLPRREQKKLKEIAKAFRDDIRQYDKLVVKCEKLEGRLKNEPGETEKLAPLVESARLETDGKRNWLIEKYAESNAPLCAFVRFRQTDPEPNFITIAFPWAVMTSLALFVMAHLMSTRFWHPIVAFSSAAAYATLGVVRQTISASYEHAADVFWKILIEDDTAKHLEKIRKDLERIRKGEQYY